ncbi:MAG: hypothetical protein EOR73_29990 [Mesorhizobium sp.]|nr:MAG: hypothetical protein EOR73_29990 [Mesorhizobium sp.]
MQQSVSREPTCGIILILIGVDPIAIEPALLGVLLLASLGQSRISSALAFGQTGHCAGAGAFNLTAEVMSILPPDAI